MPRTLGGKRMTAHEHEIWKSAFESAKRNHAGNPGAIATSAVQKYRAAKRRIKK
jgi:hypothetical protein